MVLPGDKLNIKIRHVGMRDGHIAVKIETFNNCGKKVLEGSAKVTQPTTVICLKGAAAIVSDRLKKTGSER